MLKFIFSQVDFEQPVDIVVSEAGMTLETHESMPMEYENTEEQPILMDTANEEIIGNNI